MNQKTITHNEISLTVSEASILMALKRDRLRADAYAADDHEIELRILRVLLYPNLIACTADVDGLDWPISFDEFVSLPEKLIVKWEDAAKELNPHWFIQESEEDKKKGSKSKQTA